MSDQEQESMSESELAEWFSEEAVLGNQPRSVGEALAAADRADEPVEPEEQVDAEQPLVIEDEPTPAVPVEQPEAPEAPEAPEGEELVAEEEDENLVWAKKKYGDDPTKWAQAARAQEQHISRIAGEKKEAEELAAQWYEYAQEMESQSQSQQQMGMPMSTQEEQWVESSLSNPYAYARQAANQGNVQLYQAVLTRVAEENPGLAAQVGAQVQMEMQQMAQAEQQNGAQQPSLQESMGESIQRLGIDLGTYGEPMSVKVGELGEYHPYVQAILEGDQGQRDLALMAVYDLVRAGTTHTRKVRNEDREAQIRQEAELRRQAAGVVTGGPEAQPGPEQSPLMAAMEEEWRARGQWRDDE